MTGWMIVAAVLAALGLLGLLPVPLHIRLGPDRRRRLTVMGRPVPTRHRALRQNGPAGGLPTELGLAMTRVFLLAHWRRFDLAVVLGMADAAATALWVGTVQAAWGAFSPFVCDRMAPAAPRVRLEPDYRSVQIAVDLDWILAPRLYALAMAAAGVLLRRAPRPAPSPPPPASGPTRRRPYARTLAAVRARPRPDRVHRVHRP